ncbi:MAG: DUF4062 domain-containing protein [Rhodocyclaceae bacterium]|nr:DUF4062 domain-containing protein [Rhodocyclaceae bacterium]
MRAYLSSTLKDLKDEREAVKLALGGIWEVVESYDADDETVSASCVRDVASCQLYVAIIGLRYGYIPPGCDKSITELEFDAATSAGIRRLVFVKKAEAVAAAMADSHTGECEPHKILAFRERLTEAPDGLRPAEFSDCLELTRFLLRVLPAPAAQIQLEAMTPAPDGDTDLERMLSRHLNDPQASATALATLAAARAVAESETLADVREGMPCDLFRLAVADPPLKLLVRLKDFAASGPVAGVAARAFATDAQLRETVLRMMLVAAERYVQDLKARKGKALTDADLLGDPDHRLNAILAAASFGFGVRLLPGHALPQNFVRVPAAELGFEEGATAIRRELSAQCNRMRGVRFSPELLEVDQLDEEILLAELEDLKACFGCGLVLVGGERGMLADAGLRQAVRDELGVPTVLFAGDGVPPSNGDAAWLVNSLRRLIGPLLDAALGCPPGVAPEPAAGKQT